MVGAQLETLVRWIGHILVLDLVAICEFTLGVDKFRAQAGRVIVLDSACSNQIFLEVRGIELVYFFVVFQLTN